ncbi:hypothetical protein GOODEAATRI_016175, partial [Goodea atripinnis]
MDPSLYSLKRPKSSAPDSSLSKEAPTKNRLRLSFSSAPTPGPSCSTSNPAPEWERGHQWQCVESSGEKPNRQGRMTATPPICGGSLILLSSHVTASSLVSETSSNTTSGSKGEELLSAVGIIPSAGAPAPDQQSAELHYCQSVMCSFFRPDENQRCRELHDNNVLPPGRTILNNKSNATLGLSYVSVSESHVTAAAVWRSGTRQRAAVCGVSCPFWCCVPFHQECVYVLGGTEGRAAGGYLRGGVMGNTACLLASSASMWYEPTLASAILLLAPSTEV